MTRLTCALIYLAAVAMGLAAWLFDWSAWHWAWVIMEANR